MSHQRITVLYHANCVDGFGAAWAASRSLGRHETTFIPVSYGRPVPAIDGTGPVYILDFSYPREQLTALARVHERVKVIDHHQTAEQDLATDWPGKPENIQLTFDGSQSGAVLAWKYFHGGLNKIPEILLYIQDRDLWKWDMKHSNPVNEALQSLELREFNHYDILYGHWREELPRLINDGAIALKIKAAKVESAVKARHWLDVGGVKVPAVNGCVYPSETADALLKAEPGKPFGVVWWINGDGSTQYSLRSRDGFDVSAVAKEFGGGGHRAAAGFKIAPDASALRVIPRY